MNILQQVRLTLPSAASGISSYLSFCSLLRIAPFPPTITVVFKWSCPFTQGKTYGLYVNHLTKACQILQIDTSWENESVRAAIEGIDNKPPRKFRLHNSLAPQLLGRLIRADSWESHLAGLCYVSCLFFLGPPSEALPLCRALPSDRLLADQPCSGSSLIGLMGFQGIQRLVLKLARRKNTKAGFAATLPCFLRTRSASPQTQLPHTYVRGRHH